MPRSGQARMRPAGRADRNGRLDGYRPRVRELDGGARAGAAGSEGEISAIETEVENQTGFAGGAWKTRPGAGLSNGAWPRWQNWQQWPRWSPWSRPGVAAATRITSKPASARAAGMRTAKRQNEL